MKVLYIHQYFTTRDGAQGTRSYEFAKHLVKEGHEVTMLTGDSALQSLEPTEEGIFTRRYLIDGIHVIAVHNSYSNYMSFFRRVLSFFSFVLLSTIICLTLKKQDIVLATSTPLTVVIPALLMKKLKRVPFVFEVRDLWPEAPIQIGAIRSPLLISLLRYLEKKAYKEAEHVVALSPGMADGVRQTGIDPDKVSMIPNCSDLDMFSPDKVDPSMVEDFTNRHGLAGKLVITHAGSMGIANGLEYVVEAARLLAEQQETTIVFVLAGDGKTKPELEAFCRMHALSNVMFIGSIPRKEMPVLLAASHLTITSFKDFPILTTNSPNKFFDSLAAGKPIIVNSAGWTKEIVEKHGAGFFVDPKKPDELASLLIQVKNGSYDLTAMGVHARVLAQDTYERIKLATQMEAILGKAVSRLRVVSSNRRVSRNEG